MTREEANKGVGVTMENAIKYFKSHCKIFCDDFMKKIPEDSVAYQATLKEKEFYDLAIKALEKAREEKSLVYDNEEPSVFSCGNCKYEPLSPEVEPCCDCKNSHKNYFEMKTCEATEMTREEAITHGKEQLGVFGGKHAEFIKLALKALEKEPILGKIRAEIEQEYKVESEHPYGQGLRRALEIIDKYKGESEVSE